MNILDENLRQTSPDEHLQFFRFLKMYHNILKISKGGAAISISKHFVNAHLGLDLIVNQSVQAFTKYAPIRNQRFLHWPHQNQIAAPSFHTLNIFQNFHIFYIFQNLQIFINFHIFLCVYPIFLISIFFMCLSYFFNFHFLHIFQIFHIFYNFHNFHNFIFFIFFNFNLNYN